MNYLDVTPGHVNDLHSVQNQGSWSKWRTILYPCFMYLYVPPTYKLTKFIVPLLKSLTTIELTVKDSFYFAEEVVDQQIYFFMGSFDVDSLFTNILFEETIKIWTNELFKKSETIEGSKKFEFKELLSLATKDSHFICDGTLYK